MQNNLTVSIKPYTNRKGVTSTYVYVEGSQVYGGKLLLNGPACEAILANADKLRLFLAEHAEAKPQPKTAAAPDVSAIVALLQNNPNVVAALQTVTSHHAGGTNGRFNPAPR